MRIGIVTLPLHNNYGGILQNWALQQVLIRMGHEPITIDAYVKYPYSHYVLRQFAYYCSRLIGKNLPAPQKPFMGRVTDPMLGEFIVNNIKLTKPVRKYYSRLIKRYRLDVVVVGSDQIWRPKYNERIETAFLDFLLDYPHIRRYAFSVSLGTDKWEFSEQETANCRFLIKRFDAISVREMSAVELISKYLNVKPLLTLDPTLLLDAKDYCKLCEDIPRSKEPYIAIYCLDTSSSFTEKCRNLSKVLHLPMHFFSAENNSSLTVNQWIAMFRDARFVITDSYHGTIFSILFDKPVMVYENKDRGVSRIETLLALFKYIANELGFITIQNKDVSLGLLRQESINFLRGITDGKG